MIRYFAIATVIVLTVVVLATAWENRELIRIRIASTSVPAPPKPADSTGGGGVTVPFRGDAPWALSALPECLTQLSVSTGRLAYVRSRYLEYYIDGQWQYVGQDAPDLNRSRPPPLRRL